MILEQDFYGKIQKQRKKYNQILLDPVIVDDDGAPPLFLLDIFLLLKMDLPFLCVQKKHVFNLMAVGGIFLLLFLSHG